MPPTGMRDIVHIGQRIYNSKTCGWEIGIKGIIKPAGYFLCCYAKHVSSIFFYKTVYIVEALCNIGGVLMLDEKECFFKVAESLKKYRRAELKNEDGKSVLDDMYVDLLEGDLVLNKCLLDNTTYLIGRKGTGKSTIFLKLEEEYRKRKGYFPCYIDAKTIFESSKSQSIGMDDVILQPMDKTTVDKYLVAREFIGEVLSRIYVEIDNQRKTVFQKIKNSIIGDKNEKLKNEIDNLKRSIKENKEIREITLPGIIQVKKRLRNQMEKLKKRRGI
ncbi:hypothetical protein SAMN04487861_11065 [Selenomonas ruminantium]|uniref:Uncharacterized protein n=1 Tax=Selenomonas ruminantium TaxID=971 RepID=A0A1I3EIG4_SELRU|nr:hypothetical protein [Selenomonas ruminantium]SFH98784.1 hypothetical protein SAMN04487861_11065 [Selenomonas ruminantium]